MSTTGLDPHTRIRDARRADILDTHRAPDGSVDCASLVAAAVKARQEVQRVEQTVNKGNVPASLREHLVILTIRDIDHRALLTAHVPGWDAAVEQARARHPRCQRAKVMVRAARSLGLWSPPENTPGSGSHTPVPGKLLP